MYTLYTRSPSVPCRSFVRPQSVVFPRDLVGVSRRCFGFLRIIVDFENVASSLPLPPGDGALGCARSCTWRRERERERGEEVRGKGEEK